MLEAVSRAYKDVYAALYGFILKQWHGDEYMASFFTATAIAGAQGMNMALVLGVVVAIRGPLLLGLPMLVFFIPPTGLILFNYCFLVHNDRYLPIVRQFQARPPSAQRRARIMAWSYTVASYGLPCVLGASMAFATR